MKWKYRTRIGDFFIVFHNGRYHPVFDDEKLGSYATPKQAADDLSGGHTFSLSSGIDTGELGIPDDLSEWEKVPPR